MIRTEPWGKEWKWDKCCLNSNEPVGPWLSDEFYCKVAMFWCKIQSYFLSQHSLILTFDTGWYWHFPLPCANRCMTGWFSHQNMRTLAAGLVPDIYCRQGDSSLTLMKCGLNLSVDTLIRFINCQLQWPCLHAQNNASIPHTHQKGHPRGHFFMFYLP